MLSEDHDGGGEVITQRCALRSGCCRGNAFAALESTLVEASSFPTWVEL